MAAYPHRAIPRRLSVVLLALVLASGAALCAEPPAVSTSRKLHDEASGLTVTVPASWELGDRPTAGRQLLIARAAPFDGDPKQRPVLVCMELDLPGVAPEGARERIEAMLDQTWRLAPPEEHVDIAPIAREDLSGIETWRTRVFYPAKNQTTLVLLQVRDGKGIYCSAAWGETHGAEMQAVWKSLAIERPATAR